MAEYGRIVLVSAIFNPQHLTGINPDKTVQIINPGIKLFSAIIQSGHRPANAGRKLLKPARLIKIGD
ncbi:hypothetical protein [Acinetobacter indicus]|uniref:hypothetical protein n=1 Tax=Acinetobacter indicus TaxID=756892 RepID=UPI0014900B30|nr:hypothetical protein [Acinetobacter indicus]